MVIKLIVKLKFYPFEMCSIANLQDAEISLYYVSVFSAMTVSLVGGLAG